MSIKPEEANKQLAEAVDLANAYLREQWDGWGTFMEIVVVHVNHVAFHSKAEGDHCSFAGQAMYQKESDYL